MSHATAVNVMRDHRYTHCQGSLCGNRSNSRGSRGRGSRGRGRGFALVLTLMLLAMAGVALGAVSRASLTQASATRQADEQLQRKWAMLSLQQTLLSQSPRILQEANDRSEQPVSVLVHQVELGGMPITLCFADEQAKFNVATLHENQGSRQVLKALPRLLEASASTARPRPVLAPPIAVDQSQADGSQQPREPAATPSRGLTSFEDLLIAPSQRELFGDGGDGAHDIQGLTHLLTLWGDGRVHFLRASPEVLIEVLGPVLGIGKVHELLALRRQMPNLRLGRAMALLELGDREQAQAAALLTDRSTCYSLRITLDPAPGCPGYHSGYKAGGTGFTSGSYGRVCGMHRRYDRLGIIDLDNNDHIQVLAW